MQAQDVLQLSFFVVVDQDEEQAAHIEITGPSPTEEANSVVGLEGLTLDELSLALQAALKVVQDLINWERVSVLAEKEMSEAQTASDNPF